MDLLTTWSSWRPPTGPPYVLDADRPVLQSARSQRSIVTVTSWTAACEAPDFAEPGDVRLHLGLLPMPFFGDLRTATIFALLLNPGLSPTDYYGEYEVPTYRHALLGNIAQSLDAEYPFMFLDPRFSWHSGFNYWHGKLAAVIRRLSQLHNVSFAEARRRLAQRFAVLQLIPYHSPNFRDADNWRRALTSTKLARQFVQDSVLPRVRSGAAIVIVTRQAEAWSLAPGPGVVIYTGQQARAAHLTPDSPGGHAILEHVPPST